ncbi:MAG: alcohol dehydrogenase catalytic domain-containing protein [Firmicutes bacterium]|nr:alcohol dehydrogenase catalytic domain-containing protein [Bacillota bacterium]
MKSWQIAEPNSIELIERESPKLEPNQIKMKIVRVALSASDVLVFDGKIKNLSYPITIGRQTVGIVAETGDDVKSVVRGNRVILDPYIVCKECADCKSEMEEICDSLKVAGLSCDGFLSDFVTTNQDYVKKLPENISDSDALFVEQAAIVARIMYELNLKKGDHIVIAGASVIGLLAAQLAIWHQFVPIVVDNRADNLKLAEELGVYYCIDSSKASPHTKIKSLTGGRMADALIYCATAAIGMSHNLQNNLECVATGGKIVLAGFCGTNPVLKVDLAEAFERQLKISSVNNGVNYLTEAINILANKSISVGKLITKEVDFDSVGEIIKEMASSPERYFKVAVKI